MLSVNRITLTIRLIVVFLMVDANVPNRKQKKIEKKRQRIAINIVRKLTQIVSSLGTPYLNEKSTAPRTDISSWNCEVMNSLLLSFLNKFFRVS